MDEPLVIDYYTDVLCVWAWIAQRRTEELESVWEDRIDLRHKYLNLFGDTRDRIQEQWSDRGGFDGFGKHVVQSAAPYDEACVNPDVWTRTRPVTSANAHLVIKSASIVASEAVATELATEFRRSFFMDAEDIGQLTVLYEIAKRVGLDDATIRERIRDGSAIAALMNDYQLAASQGISGSPSWVMNAGRQTLYGNITYHVLNANVEGLLNKHGEEASWC